MNCDKKLLIFLLFMTNFLFVGYLNTLGIYQNYFIKKLNYIFILYIGLL